MLMALAADSRIFMIHDTQLFELLKSPLPKKPPRSNDLALVPEVYNENDEMVDPEYFRKAKKLLSQVCQVGYCLGNDGNVQSWSLGNRIYLCS